MVAASAKDADAISQGSAVAVTEKLAVTNCHVIRGKDTFGAKSRDKVLFFKRASGDQRRDICVVQTDGGLPAVSGIRRYDDLKIGERVYAIGSPRGLENTISEGIISGLRERDGVRLIQTSAALSPGSSGGGLFDEQGRLIGITTFKLGGENLNFAVAADEALEVLRTAR